ncbi:hypothetical protein Tco_0536949 [Tanacetum coccineum]
MSATSSNHAEILSIHEASLECATCIAQHKDGYIKGDRFKHILSKFFFTHEFQNSGDIIVQKVCSSDNLADLFTKTLPTATFKKLVYDIEMQKHNELKVFQARRTPTVDHVCIFPHLTSQMANFAAKYSIMTQEMVDSFCDNFYIPAEVHPTAPGRDKIITQFPVNKVDMVLLDFIKTTNPRKVRAVKVQKGDDQVTLLESTRHCFMPLVIPAAGGSSSIAATEIPAPTEGGQEDVAEENAYLELADPDEGTAMVRQSEEVVTEQPKKIKKKRLIKQSDVLPAKKLRTDHPSLASGTGGKTLAGLEQIMPAGSRLLAREQSATPSVAPPSQESESFVDLSAQASLQIRTTVGSSSTLSAPVDTAAATTTSTKAKLAADVNPDLAGPSQLEESEGSDDSFYELATFDPSEAKRWGSTENMPGSEVRSRAEHELKLKEKLNAKYAARGKLLEEKDSEILRLKSQLAEKEAEAAEVVRLRDQVSSLSGEKSALTAEVSALKVTLTQKDHDISLLDSRATHLESALNDAQVACTEAGTKITSLASERDRLASEVSSLRASFKDFKVKMEKFFFPLGRAGSGTVQSVAELKYQGILGHALGRAVDFGMQEGLEAGHEHGVAGRSLSVVDAYNPEVASADYVNAVKALEDRSFPLLLFLLHIAGDKTAVGETSLSFALMNVHARAEGAKKHAAALRQLMMEIVSAPLSSQTWVGEASISAAPLSVEDYAEEDTDEALGSVVAVPHLERCCL